MWELYDITLLVIVSFKFYVMNFVDFVFNCYTHITSHVSQVFASCTHYMSYSLLNTVYVIVRVFGLTNQVCKYFEFFYLFIFMQNNFVAWKSYGKCLKILILGKLGLNLVFEKHYITYSCILFINFDALRCF